MYIYIYICMCISIYIYIYACFCMLAVITAPATTASIVATTTIPTSSTAFARLGITIPPPRLIGSDGRHLVNVHTHVHVHIHVHAQYSYTYTYTYTTQETRHETTRGTCLYDSLCFKCTASLAFLLLLPPPLTCLYDSVCLKCTAAVAIFNAFGT